MQCLILPSTVSNESLFLPLIAYLEHSVGIRNIGALLPCHLVIKDMVCYHEFKLQVAALKSMPKNAKRLTAVTPLKIHLPKYRERLIERPRLLSQFDSAPVIALISPAGSGKTTLAMQWAHAFEGAVCWLSLKPEDNDSRSFGLFIFQIMRILIPDLSETPALLLADAVDGVYEPFVDALISELVALDVHLAIVFDEAQIITKPVIINALVRFMQHMPSHIRVAFVGRGLHPFLLAQAHVITMSDLAFTMDETAQVLAIERNDALSPDIPNQIFTATEGWVMGVKMAGIALRGQDPLLESAARYSKHYLMDEVLRSLLPEQLEFMQRTCICEDMTPALCDAIIGNRNSATRLEALVNAGLFVTVVNEETSTYRYHPLFREALLNRTKQMNPIMLTESHRRAAAWYASGGLYREAATEAHLCGDLEMTARYALAASQQIILFSDQITFRDWLVQFPPDLLDAQPRLRLFALMAAAAADRDEAATEAHFQRLLNRPDAHQWRGEIEFARAYRLWVQPNRGHESIPYLEAALQYLQRDALYAYGLHLLSLLYESRQPAKAIELLEDQYRVAGEIQSPILLLHATNNLLYFHALAGDLNHVLQLANDALTVINANRLKLGQLGLNAERAIRRHWSGALLQRGAVKEAEAALLPAFTHPEQSDPRLLWQLYARRAEISAFQGDFVAMERAFQYGKTLKNRVEHLYQTYLGVIEALFEAQRTRVLLRWHDVAAARRWLEINLTEKPDLMLEFAIAHVPAHALIVMGDYPQALEQLESVIEDYRHRNMQAAITQTLALKVLAYWLLKDAAAARNVLDAVVDRTVHTGEVLPLALKALIPLLRERIREYWEAGEDARADHLRRAIGMMQEEVPSLPLSPFTPAEENVAKRIVQGYSITDIMEQTGTSLSNVRHRTRSIYAKMLTHNREKLIERLHAIQFEPQ